MWNWYNRPGGYASLPARTIVLVVIVAGLVIGVLMMGLLFLLAPFIMPLPAPR